MISKITELYILWEEIQTPTEKDRLVLKWLQRWQNLTFFVGTFKFWLKKQFSIEMISKSPALYILSGDIKVSTEKRNSLVLKWFQRWQNHVFFEETFKFQLKNHFSIVMISTIKELYILCGDIQIPTEKHRLLLKWFQRWQNLTSFVGTLKFQLKKTVQHWHDFKDHRALHPLRGDSDPNWERQFSIEMITKMTEPYILWGNIQIPMDKTSHLLLGHSNSIGKNSSVPKWFQKWQKLTSFLGTLKFQLKKTVQYWNDFKDHRTLHPLWDIQIPTENNSLLLKW